MKKNLLLAALVVASPVVFAQGYVGAIASVTKLADACSQSLRCGDSKSNGFKLFGGAYLPQNQVLNLGFAKLNRVEVAAMRFGKTSSSGQATNRIYDDVNDLYVDVNVAAKYNVQADAIVGAAVMEVPLFDQLVLATKLGLAYVSATVETQHDGRRFNSKTKSSVQPYAGLALEYALPGDVRLQGGVDWTRYRVDGRSGGATQVGLGASVAF